MLFINESKVVIFDLDGCIYHGKDVQVGAKECVEWFIKKGKKIYFLTNNSYDSRDFISQKLTSMSIPHDIDNIITASMLIGEYIVSKYGRQKIVAIGSEELSKSLQQHGHNLISYQSKEECDCVVVGLDKEFSYEKLFYCIQKISQGAKLLACNMDSSHPGEDKTLVPETGSLVAAIQFVLEEAECDYAGKPNGFSFEKILRMSESSPSTAIMIGDNFKLDICGANKLGINTIYINNYKKKEDISKSNIAVESLKDLLKILSSSKEVI